MKLYHHIIIVLTSIILSVMVSVLQGTNTALTNNQLIFENNGALTASLSSDDTPQKIIDVSGYLYVQTSTPLDLLASATAFSGLSDPDAISQYITRIYTGMIAMFIREPVNSSGADVYWLLAAGGTMSDALAETGTIRTISDYEVYNYRYGDQLPDLRGLFLYGDSSENSSATNAGNTVTIENTDKIMEHTHNLLVTNRGVSTTDPGDHTHTFPNGFTPVSNYKVWHNENKTAKTPGGTNSDTAHNSNNDGPIYAGDVYTDEGSHPPYTDSANGVSATHRHTVPSIPASATSTLLTQTESGATTITTTESRPINIAVNFYVYIGEPR